jgi:hypothetical protein
VDSRGIREEDEMARFTKRLPVALTDRDVARIKQAAAIEDVAASQYVRQAIRERLARDLGAPPRRHVDEHHRPAA